MTSRFGILLICLALLVSWGCRRAHHEEDAAAVDVEATAEAEPSPADQAAEKLGEAYDAAETPEEKVALVRAFLAEFPESDHTDGALGAAVGHLADDLDRPDEAYALVEEVLGRIEDPVTRLEAQMQIAVLHSKTGRLAELTAFARELAVEHEFKYTDYLQVMEMASEAAAWELVIEEANASLALATPEAFMAQYEDMSAEDAERYGARRIAFSLAFKGWALANQGNVDAAIEAFEIALPNTTYNLMGVDDTDLHLNWGRTLMLQGEAEAAMEKLAVEAIHGSDEASETFAEAWSAVHGGDEGLEDRLWELRDEHAVELPQFALSDYDGKTVDTADFDGDVLLVAAWFPT